VAKRVETIEAAGGVVWRRDGGRLEVLLVHRPKYDDWSFPKGKIEVGEQPVEAAVREVLEETGHTCEVGAKLASARYSDRKGRAKRVRYWAMTVLDGSFSPCSEVDEIRWVGIDVARREIPYAHDADLLDELLAVLIPSP
jgi:8-oxo-dGTP diphosphatase